MREIKFRAWDKHHKVFVDQRKFCIRLDGEIVVLDNSGHWSTQNPADFHIVQFTGLKDKNGKEIYEGNIVSCPSGTIRQIGDKEYNEDGSFKTWYASNPPNIYTVYNLGYAFFLGRKEDHRHAGIINHQTHKMWFDLEVIGNIYENPELMEK